MLADRMRHMGSIGTAAAMVDLDGTNDYLSRGADLTGSADGKVGLISFWFRVDGGTGNDRSILAADSDFFGAGIYGSTFGEMITIRGFTSGAGETLRLQSSTTFAAGGTVHHCMASWNLATAATHLYIDGADDKAGSPVASNNDIDYTRTDYFIGKYGSSINKWNGLIGEVYFAAEYLDLSNSSNRAKFISSNRSVDLGANGSTPTGTQPLVYCGGISSAFPTNKGSGGGFTENGALADVSSVCLVGGA